MQELDQRHLELRGACAYAERKTCSYQCMVGYITVDDMTRTCQLDGKMQPPLAKCHGRHCEYLEQSNSFVIQMYIFYCLQLKGTNS